jgi:subtilisin family serine protease
MKYNNLFFYLILIFTSLNVANANNNKSRYLIYQPIKENSSFKFNSISSNSRRVMLSVAELGGTNTVRLPIIQGVATTIRNKSFNRISKKLEAQGYIIEPDYPVKIFATPNDNFYTSFQQGMTSIKAPEAWNVSTGSNNIIVGVIDTGIDYNHPDLIGNMWQDPSNGSYGYNFVTNNANPMDDHSHGTHVAGIIGATGNNSIGIAGVNWAVKLMAIKVMDANGSGNTSGIIQGVQYAVNKKLEGANIKVLNASVGGQGYSGAFQQAINNATNLGILFVAAAGNSAKNNDTVLTYPANYDNVLSVAAADNSGKLAGFSNFGKNKVHLAAPGVNVFSTIPLSKASDSSQAYKAMSGTSMAAPYVAGSAALVLTAFPDLTPKQLISRIFNTTTKLSTLNGRVRSGGLLNLDSAITTVGNKITGTVTANGQPVAGVVISDSKLGSQTTDNQGQFIFGDIQTGTSYTLRASKIGYVFPVSTYSGTVNADTTVNFTGNETFVTISGVVRVGRVGLAEVTLTDTVLGSTTTNSSGIFTFTNVPINYSYNIIPSRTGYSFSPSVAKGTANKNVSLTINASIRRATLTGTLLLNNAPFSGVTVTSDIAGSATTNSSGRFTISNIPLTNTQITLRYARRGNTIQGESVIPISGNMAVTIRFASGQGIGASSTSTNTINLIGYVIE